MKFFLPLVLVIGLLYWLFVPSNQVSEAPDENLTSETQEREVVREVPTPNTEVEQTSLAPTPTPARTPIRARVRKGQGNGSENAENVPDEVQEQVTREVVQKFEDMVYQETLPATEEARFKYLSDGFMNSLFYLNEVAAKHVETNPENLGKAMKFLALYAKKGNADEIDDSIRIVRNDFPERYHEALRELSEEDALIITDIVDNLDSEINEGPSYEGPDGGASETVIDSD